MSQNGGACASEGGVVAPIGQISTSPPVPRMSGGGGRVVEASRCGPVQLVHCGLHPAEEHSPTTPSSQSGKCVPHITVGFHYLHLSVVFYIYFSCLISSAILSSEFADSSPGFDWSSFSIFFIYGSFLFFCPLHCSDGPGAAPQCLWLALNLLIKYKIVSFIISPHFSHLRVFS